MLISSQLTLIKRCQQQGEKRYLLSKINNDSARRQSVSTMLKVRVCWPESLFDHIPWAQVPPPCMHSPYDHYHSSHSSHAHPTQSLCHVLFSVHTICQSPSALSTCHTYCNDLLHLTSLLCTALVIPAIFTKTAMTAHHTLTVGSAGALVIPGPACTEAERYCSLASTYCAFSVVHLHRKQTHWLCRQRACVCLAVQQQRLDGSLLGERSREKEGGSE